jgi:hypothetical protein
VDVSAALLLGATMVVRGDASLAGVSHTRLVLIHFHLALLGWLALLIVTVGRVLMPMLAQAPAAPRRRFPVDEVCLTVGLWILIVALPASCSSSRRSRCRRNSHRRYRPTPGAEAYVTLLLVGWAVVLTVGHASKLLSLSIWVSWPVRAAPGRPLSTPSLASRSAPLPAAVHAVVTGVLARAAPVVPP